MNIKTLLGITQIKRKSRLGAFISHIVISFVILAIALCLAIFFWFPNDLIKAGGITGLIIITGVDLILGPLLTLIVYKPNKKGLFFDLACIVTLQVSCLIYGLWSMYNQRPAIQIIAHDAVYIVSAYDTQYYGIELDTIQGKTPKIVMLDLPTDSSTWAGLSLTYEITDSKPIHLQQKLFIAIDDASDSRYSQRINILKKSKNLAQKVDRLNKQSSTQCEWIPVKSPHLEDNSIACFNKEKGITKIANSD